MTKFGTLICTLCVALIFLLVSCPLPNNSQSNGDPYNDLHALPKDANGTYTPVAKASLGSPSNSYGYYVYLPANAVSSGYKYPLLIYLHGSNYSESTFSNYLDCVNSQGVPNLIKFGNWHPQYPMIVVTPQSHTATWNASEIHAFIDFLKTVYPVDSRRIYLTGISMGAIGTVNYLSTYKNASYIAAAAPIAGNGSKTAGDNIVVPVWAFHGALDGTGGDPLSPQPVKDMIAEMNRVHPALDAKITIFPNEGHSSNKWVYPYDFSGHGHEDPNYAPFNQDLFLWMLQYRS